jgi:hypothetical protein
LVDPTSRDNHITELETQVEELKKGVGHVPIRAPAPIVVPETIHDILVELRTTCTLRDSTKMPEDIVISVSDSPSYLEGAGGKSYLQSSGYNFKRTEEEGKVTAIQNFTPVQNSDLIGRPMSALTNYSSAVLADTSVSGGKFIECNYIEMTVRMNGLDVLRTTQAVTAHMDAMHGLLLTRSLVGMKLPQ